jgi:hypothetical protein
MVAQIEQIIHAAGYGQSERERASIYLTEAEAAAISASKQSMVKDKVFLVCDAGGGTTDLSVLRVDSTAKGRYELMPISWTEGEPIGSTLIDWIIRTRIMKRLQVVQAHIQSDLDATVSQMMSDRFETFKCSFGSVGMDVPKLILPIPGLAPGTDIPQAGIEESKIVVTRYSNFSLANRLQTDTSIREELRMAFDDQVTKMFHLIDYQLRLVRERHPGESVVSRAGVFSCITLQLIELVIPCPLGRSRQFTVRATTHQSSV